MCNLEPSEKCYGCGYWASGYNEGCRMTIEFKKNNPSNITDDEAKWDRVPTKIMMDEVLSVDLQVSSTYTPDKSQKEDN